MRSKCTNCGEYSNVSDFIIKEDGAALGIKRVRCYCPKCSELAPLVAPDAVEILQPWAIITAFGVIAALVVFMFTPAAYLSVVGLPLLIVVALAAIVKSRGKHKWWGAILLALCMLALLNMPTGT